MGVKKKLSDSEIAKRFDSIDRYKWEFLRRSEKYIKDCETWSPRKRAKWGRDEVIIGYPFCGNLEIFSKPERFQLTDKKVREYWDDFGTEWQSLGDDPTFIQELKRKGLMPSEFRSSGTWHPYARRWGINLPLNPFIPFKPWFVRIAERDVIREIHMQGAKNSVFINDIFLEHGTKSFIEVDWAADAQYLRVVFDRMVDAKTQYLKALGRGPKDIRNRFDKYEEYLKVWDLKKEGLSLSEIADKLSTGKHTKTEQNIRQALEAATKLIDGGYKDIGA